MASYKLDRFLSRVYTQFQKQKNSIVILWLVKIKLLPFLNFIENGCNVKFVAIKQHKMHMYIHAFTHILVSCVVWHGKQ